jgi:DNA-binding MarR family transcriptional regulator
MSTDSAKSQTSSGPSVCACVNVRRAARAITRIYDKALEPSNLKVTQYSMLANIMHSGPINLSNLAQVLNLDRTTLVRNLKSMEASGFTENVATSDPRERLIALSASGRQAVEAALPYWRAAQKQMRDAFGRERLEQLAALAESLEALSDHGES